MLRTFSAVAGDTPTGKLDIRPRLHAALSRYSFGLHDAGVSEGRENGRAVSTVSFFVTQHMGLLGHRF